MLDKGKKLFLIGVIMFGVMTLGGCGDGTEKTKEGMQKIEELDYRSALSCFEEAEVLGENKRLIARGKGIASMGLTEYEQAIAFFQQALKMGDGRVEDLDFDLNFYLAAAYTKEGQLREAKDAYDAILELRPQEKEAYFLRGNVRLALNDYQGGKEDFDRVLEMEPNNYDRYISIFERMDYYGYGETGREYLRSALEKSGDKMNAYDSGRVYYYLGDYQKAYIALEKAKEKGDAQSYLYLGKAYEATGDYNYASSVYSSYLAKHDKTAEICNQLGLCELNKKDYQKALEAFQMGKELGDSQMQQTLAFNEIVAYEYLENYEEAKKLLDSYLLIYPDDTTAQRERQFLMSR